jgi:hypothetical protein
MPRLLSLAIIATIVVVSAALGIHYYKQFKRVQGVEVGTTSLQLGIVNRVVFTNQSSSNVEFLLRCYNNTHEEGRIFPSTKIVITAREAIEFDVYPDLQANNLPPAIANRTCTAVWQGPFGYERRAWRAHWQYFRPTAKVTL